MTKDFKLPNYPITQLLNFLMNAVLIIDKPSGFTSHDIVARVRRILQQLEDENGRLKRMVADQMLDNVMLRELRRKNF